MQVAGHFEKEQRHGVKLRIGWSCHVVFNVVSQRPFSIMIEEISSRNGLLPLSNVHLLSVTYLLQRNDCCYYKREDQLKKRDQQDTTRTTNLFQKQSQALTIASCVKILSALKFKCKRATSLSFRAAHCVYSSSPQLFWSSLSFSTTASESHLRE